MDSKLESALQDLWQHLTSDRQAWLFGAGISYRAGVPLMRPLTDYVDKLIEEEEPDKLPLLRAIRAQLPPDCHIEHILSQLGDFIALAGRSRSTTTVIDGLGVHLDSLDKLHSAILDRIGRAVRYGYRAAKGEQAEIRGTPDCPIVTVEDHRAFVRHLFAARSKPGISQQAVSFFTTNYDTLLEDALALQRIPYNDGFVGGAMAFWAPAAIPDDRQVVARTKARVTKLHGSVDWHLLDDGSVMRCRNSCQYPERTGNLLIYPQSTKYIATQKDPFAGFFAQFRHILSLGPDNVLGICGYSFGDDHVDGEIEAAMSQPGSKTVIIAFAEELETDGKFQLPKKLVGWLQHSVWRQNLFVASNRGLYHGSMDNLCEDGASLNWWTFQGLTSYLAEGPEVLPSSPDKKDALQNAPVESDA